MDVDKAKSEPETCVDDVRHIRKLQHEEAGGDLEVSARLAKEAYEQYLRKKLVQSAAK
jgi:hypothetical protein